MSEQQKSKWPDLTEISNMASKFFGDIKKSVCEIVADYQKNHPSEDSSSDTVTGDSDKPAAEKPEQNKSKKED